MERGLPQVSSTEDASSGSSASGCCSLSIFLPISRQGFSNRRGFRHAGHFDENGLTSDMRAAALAIGYYVGTVLHAGRGERPFHPAGGISVP